MSAKKRFFSSSSLTNIFKKQPRDLFSMTSPFNLSEELNPEDKIEMIEFYSHDNDLKALGSQFSIDKEYIQCIFDGRLPRNYVPTDPQKVSGGNSQNEKDFSLNNNNEDGVGGQSYGRRDESTPFASINSKIYQNFSDYQNFRSAGGGASQQQMTLTHMRMQSLYSIGNLFSLQNFLKVDMKTGLDNFNDNDLEVRKKFFGSNTLPVSISGNLFDAILHQLQKKRIRLLILLIFIIIIIEQLFDTILPSRQQMLSQMQQMQEVDSEDIFTLMNMDYRLSFFFQSELNLQFGIAFILIITILLKSFKQLQLQLDRQQQMLEPTTIIKVRRNAREKLIESSKLVVGDILLVQAGDILKVDGILSKQHDLVVEEYDYSDYYFKQSQATAAATTQGHYEGRLDNSALHQYLDVQPNFNFINNNNIRSAQRCNNNSFSGFIQNNTPQSFSNNPNNMQSTSNSPIHNRFANSSANPSGGRNIQYVRREQRAKTVLTNERIKLKKQAPESRYTDLFIDPFMISGSLVMEGEGEVLVCEVGVNTVEYRARNNIEQNSESQGVIGLGTADNSSFSGLDQSPLAKKKENSFNPLQIKLEEICAVIGRFGLNTVTIISIIFIVRLLWDWIHVSWLQSPQPGTQTSNTPSQPQWLYFFCGMVIELLRFCQMSVALSILIVPEGLTTALNTNLQYSLEMLKKKGVIVKNIVALEWMGFLNNIIVDKTGCMTQNTNEVVKVFTAEHEHECAKINKRHLESRKDKLVFEYLLRGICINSAAHINIKDGKTEGSGSKIEQALLEWANKMGFDQQQIRHSTVIKEVKPFKSTLRRMITVTQDKEKLWVLVKGSPDVLLEQCTGYYDENSIQMKGFNNYQNKIKEKINEYSNYISLVKQTRAKLSVSQKLDNINYLSYNNTKQSNKYQQSIIKENTLPNEVLHPEQSSNAKNVNNNCVSVNEFDSNNAAEQGLTLKQNAFSQDNIIVQGQEQLQTSQLLNSQNSAVINVLNNADSGTSNDVQNILKLNSQETSILSNNLQKNRNETHSNYNPLLIRHQLSNQSYYNGLEQKNGIGCECCVNEGFTSILQQQQNGLEDQSPQKKSWENSQSNQQYFNQESYLIIQGKSEYKIICPLRLIMFVQKQIPLQHRKLQDEELLKDLYFVGLVGIKDPWRLDLQNAIQDCTDSGINVRLITGDKLYIVNNQGEIFPKYNQDDDMNEDNQQKLQKEELFLNHVMMSGRSLSNQIQNNLEQPDNFNIEEFKKVIGNLKVLQQSHSTHKMMLVKGLIQLKYVVGVTGDDTDDCKIMKEAQVSFALGSGTDVVKQAASIILQNDSFHQIIDAILFGKNIYEFIRKFFQVTLIVNYTILAVTLYWVTYACDYPFNAAQILFLNLIIDEFSSQALAKISPNCQLLKLNPVSGQEYIILPTMWRNIIVQVVYQFCLLLMILKWNFFSDNLNTNYTMAFASFFFLQLFNILNTSSIHDQFTFWNRIRRKFKLAVLLMIFAVLFFVGFHYFSIYFGSIQLQALNYFYCFIIGMSGMIVNSFMRRISSEGFKCFNFLKFTFKFE